jgi:hypothetical protein
MIDEGVIETITEHTSIGILYIDKRIVGPLVSCVPTSQFLISLAIRTPGTIDAAVSSPTGNPYSPSVASLWL